VVQQLYLDTTEIGRISVLKFYPSLFKPDQFICLFLIKYSEHKTSTL